MQTNFRYFPDRKIMLFLLVLVLGFFNLKSAAHRNPFCFSDIKNKLPFSYVATAKVHNCSKSFAILSYVCNSNNQKVIVQKGDTVLGYKIVDIFEDVITVQDDKNNEVTLHLN